MPVYEYQCGACSHEFEEWQKITSDPIKTCPKCGKDEVQRLISQTAFQLKGGGWYKDLYSSSGKKNDKSSDKSGSETKGSGDGASNGKSDSGSKSDSTAKSESKSDSGKASASTGTSSGSSGGSGGTASNK